MTKDTLEEALAYIKEHIETRVTAGFDTPEDILEGALDIYYGEFEPHLLEPDAKSYLAKALEEHFTAQESWDEITDCDRLDQAFAELTAAGIAAIQNGVCCQTCAFEDVHTEVDRMQTNAQIVRGYTFYHEQDTENAASSDALFLAYGGMEENEKSSLQIGQEVAETLRKHGFAIEWDGSIRKRIKVLLHWQKRRSR